MRDNDMKIQDRILNGLIFIVVATLTVSIPIGIFSVLTWFFNPMVGIIGLFILICFVFGFCTNGE